MSSVPATLKLKLHNHNQNAEDKGQTGLTIKCLTSVAKQFSKDLQICSQKYANLRSGAHTENKEHELQKQDRSTINLKLPASYKQNVHSGAK